MRSSASKLMGSAGDARKAWVKSNCIVYLRNVWFLLLHRDWRLRARFACSLDPVVCSCASLVVSGPVDAEGATLLTSNLACFASRLMLATATVELYLAGASRAGRRWTTCARLLLVVQAKYSAVTIALKSDTTRAIARELASCKSWDASVHAT